MEDEPVLIKDWVRERILGSGGFGVVALWINTVTEEKIAIKKCRWGTEAVLTEKHKERWTKEVEIMQRIQNDNIVAFRVLPEILETTLNKYNIAKLPMLSMEYCTQGDLRQVLNRSENCCGLLEADCRNILYDIKNAVQYLHSLKITHRDLKPENIVLQNNDSRHNGIIYKLIDLGYAKEIDSKSICASFVGTLQYLAPELMYAKSYSNSVDYWSFGLLAFEIMCGIRPFLPHFNPGQWMEHIKHKSSDHICAFETIHNDIVFSTHMYSENHISPCFRLEIEKWLRHALDWDPKKRGRSGSELIIFSLLDDILRKKMITIFCVYTYEFLSYEIDDSTLVSTLQGWIERDTRVMRNEQFLLDLMGDNVGNDGFVTEYLEPVNKSCYFHNGPSIIVFKKGSIIEQTDKGMSYTPRIPKLVLEMLENPYQVMPYVHQKRSYSQGLYCIYQENRLYNTLLEACIMKINYLLKKFDDTRINVKKMNDNFLKIEAQKEYASEMFNLDLDRAKDLNILSVESVYEKFKKIGAKIDTLMDVTGQITVRFESAVRRTNVLNTNSIEVYSKVKEHDLNVSLEDALQCYNAMKSKPKELRDRNENCISMVKIIYNCLKQRDKLLRDCEFHQYIQQIVDITNEYEKMIVPLESAIQHIEKFKIELLTFQQNHQKELWNIVKKLKSNPQDNELYSHIKPKFIIGNPKNADQSLPLPKPLEFIIGDKEEAKLSFKLKDDKKSLPNSLDVIVEDDETNNHKEEAKIIFKQSKNDFKSLPNMEKAKLHVKFKNDVNSLPNHVDDDDDERIYENDIDEVKYLNTDTEDLIYDNLSLRVALQDKTNETFIQYKSILNESFMFDFLSSVNEQ